VVSARIDAGVVVNSRGRVRWDQHYRSGGSNDSGGRIAYIFASDARFVFSRGMGTPHHLTGVDVSVYACGRVAGCPVQDA
jgi:hypothetical protein